LGISWYYCFACVFLLIGRVYVAKDKKYDETSDVLGADPGNEADSDLSE
jgi:hypothetical protein